MVILASVFLNLDRDWPVLVEQFDDKSYTQETLRFAIHTRFFLNLKVQESLQLVDLFNRSERCIPIKLLVTTFDNSNSYWNCHSCI